MNNLPLNCNCPTAPIPDYHDEQRNIHIVNCGYVLIHAPGCPLEDTPQEAK